MLAAPIGVPHTFSNPDPDEWATFMCTVAQDLYIDYFRKLAELRAQPGGMDVRASLELRADYATEPYRQP